MEKPLNRKRLNYIAIVLIALSGVFFGLIFLVPFLTLSLKMKGVLISVFFISCEISWWLAVVIVGKQLITKYKKKLNPYYWFVKQKDKENNNQA
ncbi:MAG: transporter suffix domain-containing protein [Bacteroidetes bacterium]|nr:transporter suffix domain-containing protein [Bacteroidota bacterium]